VARCFSVSSSSPLSQLTLNLMLQACYFQSHDNGHIIFLFEYLFASHNVIQHTVWTKSKFSKHNCYWNLGPENVSWQNSAFLLIMCTTTTDLLSPTLLNIYMNESIAKWSQIYTKGITLSTTTNMSTCTFCRWSRHNSLFRG